jgi:hypothetical protein
VLESSDPAQQARYPRLRGEHPGKACNHTSNTRIVIDVRWLIPSPI